MNVNKYIKYNKYIQEIHYLEYLALLSTCAAVRQNDCFVLKELQF